MAKPIVHIEFATKDPETAGKFYSDVFGWKITTDPEFNYHMFQAEPGTGGGFMKVGDGQQSGPIEYKAGDVLVYIDSDDIDATLATIESHGGKILLPKTEIPHTGWFGVFSDPTGNRLALYTSIHQHT